MATASNTPSMPGIRDLIRAGIGVPIGVLGVLAMVVLPLPPMMLDVLFTFNIALSLVIVMAVSFQVEEAGVVGLERGKERQQLGAAVTVGWHFDPGR